MSDVWSVSFSPGSDFIVTSGTDFQTNLWRQSEILQQDTISYSSTLASEAQAISPDGKILALNAAGSPNAISLWNVATKQLLFVVSTNISQVDSIAFAPTGKILAIGGRNGDVALIDAENGTEIRHFQPHEKRIGQITFSPDGETFLTAGYDNTAKLWRTADLTEIHSFAHTNGISVVGFTDGGKAIFVGSLDYTADLWNAQNFERIAEITGHTQPILSFADGSSGETFATGGADGLIKTWNSKTGSLLHTLTGNAGHVTALTFTPDETRLASASKDGVIRLWKLNTIDDEPQQVLAFDAPAAVTNFIYFTPDENLLITSGISQKTHLWPATPISQISQNRER